MAHVQVVRNLVGKLKMDDLGEIQDIMASTINGGTTPEGKSAKLVKFIIGEPYVEAVAQKEMYENLIEAMSVMAVSIYAAEFFTTETYNHTEFRKLIDARTALLTHLNMEAMVNSVASLTIAAPVSMYLSDTATVPMNTD